MAQLGPFAFRYTEAQARAILGALHENLLPGVRPSDVLAAISRAAVTALVRHDPQTLYAPEAGRRLHRVAKASLALVKALHALPWDLEGGLHTTLSNSYIEPDLETDLRRLYALGPTRLRALLAALGEAALRELPYAWRSRPRSGRPIHAALHAFLIDLCGIFHESTGWTPGLTRPTIEAGGKGRFYPFAVAAIEPTGLGHSPYLDHPIRSAVKEYRRLHSGPERAAPSRKAKILRG